MKKKSVHQQIQENIAKIKKYSETPAICSIEVGPIKIQKTTLILKDLLKVCNKHKITLNGTIRSNIKRN